MAIDNVGWAQKDFQPAVMDDVFVIGYPWSLNGGGKAMPIYKRGTVASEPELPQGPLMLPYFLIDCRTAESMSGAPVWGVSRDVWHPQGKFSDGTIIGRVENFIGVYSGRMFGEEGAEKEEIATELGRVWQGTLVQQIIENGKPGSKLSDLIKNG